MIHFLHIPKTGCTSIKYALVDNPQDQLTVVPETGHRIHLSKISGDVAFVIRDPWQRFCSGFWERKTMPQRRKISKSMDVPTYGYKQWSQLETQILTECATPEQFFVWAYNNRDYYRALDTLHGITDSMCRWLGKTALQYSQWENRVRLVCDIKNLSKVIKTQFDLELPTDPFRKRSRELFDMDQSYTVSDHNLALFKQWRNTDYELINYIKQQPYYTQ